MVRQLIPRCTQSPSQYPHGREYAGPRLPPHPSRRTLAALYWVGDEWNGRRYGERRQRSNTVQTAHYLLTQVAFRIGLRRHQSGAVHGGSRAMDIRYALSDNIGLGGHNGAVIFKRYDGD